MIGMDLTEWNKFIISLKSRSIHSIFLELESRFSGLDDRITRLEEEVYHHRQLLEDLQRKPVQTPIWDEIKNYLEYNRTLTLLNPRKEYPFKILDLTDEIVTVDKLGAIRLTSDMFTRLYEYLKQRGSWVKIGATIQNTKPETVEAFLKNNFHGGNMNGAMTASWVSAILVKSGVGVEFNDKAIGQAIRYKS